MIPTTPQNAAGCRTDPPVSLPRAARTTPAATAAAEPPELPPGTRSGSAGLRVGPKAECSVDEPIANSSMLVFPITRAPAVRSRVTAVASYGERYPLSSRDPQVVSSPRVAMLSLTATGIPLSAPAGMATLSSSKAVEMKAFSGDAPLSLRRWASAASASRVAG